MAGLFGVVSNRFAAIAAAFPEQLHKVVVQTVDTVAELTVANAPEATGFLKSTVYTVTSDGSTYGENALTPPGDSYLLPEGPGVSDPYSGYAAVAANYAVYPELGTRFQPAQPYFYPAVDEGRARFQAALDVFASFLENGAS